MSKKNKLSLNKILNEMEPVIYILTIFAVIFANTYGNIYIKMIPILFFLGVIGKLVFNRPIVTAVLGIVASICMIYISRDTSLIENVVVSFTAGLNILLGELLGEYIKTIYSKLNGKKSISKKKFKNSCIYSVLILFVSLLFHDFTNGNIFTYLKCEKNLYEYLYNTYWGNNKFEVVSVEYNFYKNPRYILKVRNENYNQINKFVIYLSDTSIIQDGYKKSWLDKNNIILNRVFNSYIDKHEFQEKYGDFKFEAEFIGINQVDITIEKHVIDLGNEEITKFSEEVAEIINSFKGFYYYTDIEDFSICIRNKSVRNQIASNEINLVKYEEFIEDGGNPVDYIIDSLINEFEHE